MPVDSRDDPVGELDQELVREDDPLAGLREGAPLEQFEATLNRLRQVLDRAEQRQLKPDDLPLIVDLLEAEMEKME